MSNKFSNEDIQEIISKLKWKPTQKMYNIIILIIIIISLLIIFIIIIFIKTNTYICLYEKLNTNYINLESKINNLESKINNSTSIFANKTNDIDNILSNNSNNIRYLVKTSGKNNNNVNLLQRYRQMPTFSNELDNPLLYTALNGN